MLDDTDKKIIEMTVVGLIIANCPKCRIPLSMEEFSNLACETCGELEFHDVIFRHPDTFPSA